MKKIVKKTLNKNNSHLSLKEKNKNHNITKRNIDIDKVYLSDSYETENKSLNKFKSKYSFNASNNINIKNIKENKKYFKFFSKRIIENIDNSDINLDEFGKNNDEGNIINVENLSNEDKLILDYFIQTKSFDIVNNKKDNNINVTNINYENVYLMFKTLFDECELINKENEKLKSNISLIDTQKKDKIKRINNINNKINDNNIDLQNENIRLKKQIQLTKSEYNDILSKYKEDIQYFEKLMKSLP